MTRSTAAIFIIGGLALAGREANGQFFDLNSKKADTTKEATIKIKKLATPADDDGADFENGGAIPNEIFPEASEVSKYHACLAHYADLNYWIKSPDNVIIGKCDGPDGEKTVVSFTGTNSVLDMVADLSTFAMSWKLPYKTLPNWRVLEFNTELEEDDGVYLAKGETMTKGSNPLGNIGEGGFSFEFRRGGSKGFDVYKNTNTKSLGGIVKGTSLTLDENCDVIVKMSDGRTFKEFKTFEKYPELVDTTTECRLKVAPQNGAVYVAAKSKLGITLRHIIVPPGELKYSGFQALKKLSYINKADKKKVYGDFCTGHSLGGALAKMHAYYGGCKHVVTFASPRVQMDLTEHTSYSRDYIRWGNKDSCKSSDGKSSDGMQHMRDIVTVMPIRTSPTTANPIFLSSANTGADCKTKVEDLNPTRIIETHAVASYVNEVNELVKHVIENKGENGVVQYKNLYHNCDKECKGARCPEFCGTHAVCCKKGDAICGDQGYETEKSCQFVPSQTYVCESTDNYDCHPRA